MGTEGMSSEELDKLTTEEEEQTPPVEEEETPPAEEPEEAPPEEAPPEEKPPEGADLAQAALDETEEKPEVDPKDAVIGSFRRDLRASELETARLRGQLEVQQAKPKEKSPIELAAEKQEVSVDDVEISGKLYKEQRAWEKSQAESESRQQRTQDYQSGSEAALLTMTDETLGEGLGLEAIARIGDHLLTDADRQKIFMAGKNCGSVLYKTLKERIQEAGGAAAQELQKRLKPTQAKPKKEAKGTPKKQPASQPKDEGDESEVRASTNAIMSELEMF